MTKKTAFERAAEEERELPLWREFLMFLRDNKKWWLLPMLLGLAVVGGLALFSAWSAPFLPFIYTFF